VEDPPYCLFIALAAAWHAFSFLTGVPLPAQLAFSLPAKTNYLVGFFVAEAVATQTAWALLFPAPVLPLL
jgi:hypothetical protein